jgi:hypothetical protein
MPREPALGAPARVVQNGISAIVGRPTAKKTGSTSGGDPSVERLEGEVNKANWAGMGSGIFTAGAGIAAGIAGADAGLKALGAISVVAGGAFPAALPVIAASALVVAIFLQYYAGSVELMAYMGIISEQFTEVIDFFNLASIISTTMQDKTTDEKIKKFDFRLAKVKAFAKLFIKELLKYSPDSMRQKMISESGKQDEIMTLIKETKPLEGLKGMLARGITKLSRFFSSGAIMGRLSRYFQNFTVSCQATKDRFFLFIAMYPDLFKTAMDTIRDPNNLHSKLFDKIFFNPNTAKEEVDLNPTAEQLTATFKTQFSTANSIVTAISPAAATGGARRSRRLRRKQKHRTHRRKS